MKVSDKDGSHYLAVYYPEHPNAWKTGYLYAHRVVAEIHIVNRLLTADEVVHHMDDNKINNDPTNLGIETRAVHTARHAKPSRVLVFMCAQCGTLGKRAWNQRPEIKNQVRAFCNRECSGQFTRQAQINNGQKNLRKQRSATTVS